MNSANKISLTIISCTVVLAFILVTTTFLQMRNASPLTSLSTIQWEYISLDYSQNQTYDGVDLSLYEDLAINEPYESALFKILAEGCSTKDRYEVMLDKIAQKCLAKNFKGIDYFLNVLGKEGWEFISSTDESDEYTYKVEVLFKRLVQ